MEGLQSQGGRAYICYYASWVCGLICGAMRAPFFFLGTFTYKTKCSCSCSCSCSCMIWRARESFQGIVQRFAEEHFDGCGCGCGCGTLRHRVVQSGLTRGARVSLGIVDVWICSLNDGIHVYGAEGHATTTGELRNKQESPGIITLVNRGTITAPSNQSCNPSLPSTAGELRYWRLMPCHIYIHLSFTRRLQ